MKTFSMIKSIAVALAALCTSFPAISADKEVKPMKYVNALELKLINKGFDNSLTPYTRIPAYLKDSVRHDLWERSRCSS